MDDNAFFKWIQQHARFSEPEPVHVEGLEDTAWCIAKVEGNHQMLFPEGNLKNIVQTSASRSSSKENLPS